MYYFWEQLPSGFIDFFTESAQGRVSQLLVRRRGPLTLARYSAEVSSFPSSFHGSDYVNVTFPSAWSKFGAKVGAARRVDVPHSRLEPPASPLLPNFPSRVLVRDRFAF